SPEWNELTPSGAQLVTSIVSSQGSLYVASGNGHGIRVSPDAGSTWTAIALDGHSISRIVQDPKNPLHMLATDAVYPGGLYETSDGWGRWQFAGGGALPSGGQNQNNVGVIHAVAFDPLDPTRVYASVTAAATETVKTKLYRRLGADPWARLPVPALADAMAKDAVSIAVLPTLPSGQPHPTVFAGTVQSLDGGDSWVDMGQFQSVENMVFSPKNPLVGYATVFGNMWKTGDGGVSWQTTTQFQTPQGGSLVADYSNTQRLYTTSQVDTRIGI